MRFEFEACQIVDAFGKEISHCTKEDRFASGGCYEGATGNKGYIFTNVPASNRVWIAYAGSFTSFVNIYLLEEGEFREIGQINFSKTEGWDMDHQWVVGSDMVSIPEGATVKLVPVVDVNLDYALFTATPWYEESELDVHRLLAKNALLDGATVLEDAMAYVGKSAVLREVGSHISVTVPTLEGPLNVMNVRYKTEKPLAVALLLNGETVLETVLAASYGGKYNEAGLRLPSYQSGDVVKLVLQEKGELWLDCLTATFFRDAETVFVDGVASQKEKRRVISLDGIWQCETTLFQCLAELPKTVPSSLRFENSIPVPGLWDQASIPLGHYDRKGLWYRKLVVLDAAPTGQVILHMNRAYYGRYVYVNGELVGDYQYSYTFSQMEIGRFLRKGENEIVVMVGSQLQQKEDPQCVVHVGLDGERVHNYPGIVDSVSLLFTKMPFVRTAQTAADLENGKTLVQALLWNTSSEPVMTDVTFRVFELGVYTDGVPSQEKRLVGSLTVSGVTVPASDFLRMDTVEVELADFGPEKMWTTKNPFLYLLEVETDGDCYCSRFGMRTFYFDSKTKLPMLNGQVYYLLGTNLAVNRFYDDPHRKAYPWDAHWVRMLYEEIKDTNWDCFRIHLGSAPSFWYDLADEMGFLIMDEYAWWYCWCACTVETVRPEMEAWIDEKCNHPSVIIWDMQNEDIHTKMTGPIIQAMRSYDIQNRPWDNGWSKPVSETDSFECHPYFLSHLTFLRDLNQHSPLYENPTYIIPPDFAPNNPRINNEYTNIWINRLGEPATTAYVQYYDIVTPGGTGADRIEHYGMATGQLSEFWRSGRHFVGLMQFAALIYSKPTDQGITGDILMPDISVPRFHPNVKEYYRNAFARLGIILGDYSDSCVPGETKELPIIMVNDANEDVENLPVLVRVATAEGEIVFEEGLTFSLKEVGDPEGRDWARQVVTLTVPECQTERFIVTAEYTRNGERVYSKRQWALA